jgi:small subunit ribosomal protein S4
VQESQFQNYYKQSRKSSLNTGEELLSILERRLDNIVYRVGAAVSRTQARQKILHGEVKVSGRAVTYTSYEVKPGDALSFEKGILSERIVPDWITLDAKKKTATINNSPKRDQIKEDIREQLIIEFYSR